MKKASYSEKVFNYLNENKFDLTSLLTEEDEEENLAGDEEPNKEDEGKQETSEEEETSDLKDADEIEKAVKEKQKQAAADLTMKKVEAMKIEEPGSAKEDLVRFITKNALPDNSLKSDSYYRQVKGLQKFIFEDNSEEQVLDFENKISVPVLVNNTLDYIDKFDSMFDKPQYCYDVAVEQIIKYGGTDFEKILKDFDMQFHETYRKRFPSADESPVMSYVNNQNYKNAADAQKSG